MHMSQLLKRWRLPALAVLAVITVLGTASEAFAQGQNGESSKYTLEMVGGSGLSTQNDRCEARNGGNLLEVWRGGDNNTVWMSFNNGTPFQIGTGSATTLAPAVVPWISNGFMVFHTGIDGNIYYSWVYANGGHDTSWHNVPAQTTQMPVSVAQIGANSQNVYMVYRGFGNDTRVWGTWFDYSDNHWSQAENINGGRGNSAPTISFAPRADSLYVEVQGTDGNLWRTQQAVDAESWSPWTPILGQATGPNANRNLVNGPVASGSQVYGAVNENTDGSETIILSALDSNHVPEYATFAMNFAQLTDWTLDTTGFHTEETPELTTNGSSTYSLLLGLEDLGYWKQVFHR
jgi:hypothetical protein